jgi:hypothetical protein
MQHLILFTPPCNQHRQREVILSCALVIGIAATLIFVPFNFTFVSEWLTLGSERLLSDSSFASVKSIAPLLIGGLLIPWLFAMVDEAV